MSGHSKWATTKHKKAAIDAKRGKLFAKLIKNIEVAARTGGGDPDGNPTLWDAIYKAKKSSVPNDNIDRAVKRGSGAESGGAELGDDHLRGLRPRRGRRPHRVPHRQPQPRGGRGAHRAHPQRRLAGRARARCPTCSTARASSSCPRSRPAAMRPRTRPRGRPRRRGRGGQRQRRVLRDRSARPADVVAVRTALQGAGIDYDSAEAPGCPSMQVQLDLDGAKKMIRRHRGPRGLRRRPGRLRQRRHPRRGHRRARRGLSRGPRGADPARACWSRRSPPGCVAWRPNRCSDSAAVRRGAGPDAVCRVPADEGTSLTCVSSVWTQG